MKRTASEAGHPAESQADAIGARIGASLASVSSFGPGPLPDHARAAAEPHLGVSLAGTQLRADRGAQRKAASESVLAVTEGRTVSFAAGQFSSSTSAGRALIGHELTHVGQQAVHGTGQSRKADRGCSDRGPPRLELDKDGNPPLIYNYKKAPPNLRRERSMRPSVGYAQEKLNIFLVEFDRPQLLHRGRHGSRFPGDVALATTFRSKMSPAFLNVDCWFGDETELATKAFQAAMGLNPDGKIGPLTWPVLIMVREAPAVLGVPGGESRSPLQVPYLGNMLGLPGLNVLGASRPSQGLPPIRNAKVVITHMPKAFQPVGIGIQGRASPPTTDPKKFMFPAPASRIEAEGQVDIDSSFACSSNGKLDWVQIVYGGDDWKSWYTQSGSDRNLLDIGRLEAPHLPRSEGATRKPHLILCPPVPDTSILTGLKHVTVNFYDRPAGAGIPVQRGGPFHTGFASVGYSNTFDLVLVWKPHKKPYSIPLAYATWGLGYCVTFDMPPSGNINPSMEVFSHSASKLHGPPGFTHSIPNSLASPSPTAVAARATALAIITTHVGGPGHARNCQR